MVSESIVDIAIIGSGPAGLSCAIEASRSGLSAVILEKGSFADSIRRFPVNMVWFSTPELLEIGDVPFTIPTVRPTRVDTLNYYRRVAARCALDIRPFDAVTGVTRDGALFCVHTLRGSVVRARYVVVATGYFDHPNRLGIPGEELPWVLHYYDEPHRYAGCSVVVIGGRNSAVEAALDLYRHGVRVTLVHRNEQLSTGVKYWVQPDFENRVKAGEISIRYSSHVREFIAGGAVVTTPGGTETVSADFAFVLVGFLPDGAFLRSLGLQLDPESLAPRHHPETFETTVPGIYVAGSVAAGRHTNMIFVENGRLHGKAIVASILARRNSVTG
jgi:thioredoxin reductase (NADPH)